MITEQQQPATNPKKGCHPSSEGWHPLKPELQQTATNRETNPEPKGMPSLKRGMASLKTTKMKHLLSAFISLFILLCTLFSSCTEDNIFEGKNGLSFSQDTVSFDTLFSTIGSSTTWLKVINNDNTPLNISRVRLKSGGESGFLINLDGVNALSFSNVVIPAHDSLFLFVQLKSFTQNSDKPKFIEDAVLFETESGFKQIVLEAWSWDAIIWKGKTIRADTTITSVKPYIIYDSLVVADNVTLNIQEGTTFHMHDGSKVIVRGTIKAKGSQAAPVTFRGDRLEYILKDFPYDYNPGQWHYIQLTSGSFSNEFDQVRIRGGYYGIVADSSSLDFTKFTMTNTVIHNFVYTGLWSLNCNFTVSNSEISNSGSYTVCLIGGKYVFTHCTLANHTDLVTRDGPLLVLANYTVDSLKNEIPWPLEVSFRNTIIYGSVTEEVGLAISSNQSIGSSLFFKNCLIRTKSDLTAISSDCLFNKTPNFLKLGTPKDKYAFDFHVDSVSPALGKADKEFSTPLPTDMYGVDRLTDDAPDIGAYEFK